MENEKKNTMVSALNKCKNGTTVFWNVEECGRGRLVGIQEFWLEHVKSQMHYKSPSGKESNIEESGAKGRSNVPVIIMYVESRN